MEEIQLNANPNPSNQKMSGGKLAGIIIGSIAIIVAFIGLLFVIIPRDKSNDYLTMENFNKVSTGMSYSQVVEIFDDHQGELQSSSSYGGITMSIDVWSNESGTRVVSIMFENGAVTTKSQIGLS